MIKILCFLLVLVNISTQKTFHLSDSKAFVKQLHRTFEETLHPGKDDSERHIYLDMMQQILDQADKRKGRKITVLDLKRNPGYAFQGRDITLVLPMAVIQTPQLVPRVVFAMSADPYLARASRFIFTTAVPFMSPGLSMEHHGDTTMCYIPSQQQKLVPCKAF